MIDIFLATSFYSYSCSLVLAAVDSRHEGLLFLDSAAGQEAVLTMSRSPHPGRQDNSHGAYSVGLVHPWFMCKWGPKHYLRLVYRVMLESFISTQKMGVQKALQKKFKRFMSYKQDFLELLMAALQALVREQLRYDDMTGRSADGFLKVSCR